VGFQQAQWTNGPAVSGGEFRGTIEVDCEFDAVAGTGFNSLQQYLVDKAVKEAKTVHAGPTDVTFQGLPGKYLDVTADLSAQGNTVTVRADINLATDGSNRLVSSSKTKNITATGQAKNLKKMDMDFEIQPKGGAHYAVHAASSMVVTKPGLVPTGIFKNQVVKMIEDGLPDQEKSMIEEVANHL